MDSNLVPRISFYTTPELKAKADKYLPKDIRKLVLNAMLDDILNILENNPDEASIIIGAVARRALKITDLMR